MGIDPIIAKYEKITRELDIRIVKTEYYSVTNHVFGMLRGEGSVVMYISYVDKEEKLEKFYDYVFIHCILPIGCNSAFVIDDHHNYIDEGIVDDKSVGNIPCRKIAFFGRLMSVTFDEYDAAVENREDASRSIVREKF